MESNDGMPVVWVIQEGHNDYSPAEQFGQVNFITTSDYRAITCRQNDAVIADIKKFRSRYIMGFDYVVPVGNPIVIAMVILSLGPGRHRFLKWDGRRASYIPHFINTDKLR